MFDHIGSTALGWQVDHIGATALGWQVDHIGSTALGWQVDHIGSTLLMDLKNLFISTWVIISGLNSKYLHLAS